MKWQICDKCNVDNQAKIKKNQEVQSIVVSIGYVVYQKAKKVLTAYWWATGSKLIEDSTRMDQGSIP